MVLRTEADEFLVADIDTVIQDLASCDLINPELD